MTVYCGSMTFHVLTDWMWCLQEMFRLYSSPTHRQEYHWSRYFRLLWKRDGRILKLLRPVAYSSKSFFADSETWYSNIERELLGILFGIEHFKCFTFGRKLISSLIISHCSHCFKNPLLIQHHIYQDSYFMFLSMMWHYIIRPDPEWNCLMHFQGNPTTLQMLVIRQKVRV